MSLLVMAMPSVAAGAAPPPNDDFSDGQVLTGQTGEIGGTNVDATRESGEPHHAGQQGVASVWYRWTAPTTGTTELQVTGLELDRLLGVYEGDSLAALQSVTSSARTSPLKVQFRVVTGEEFRIAVDTVSSFTVQPGPFTLAWTVHEPPPNDAFDDAEGLEGAMGTLEGTNAGATKETGEPDHAGEEGGSSVWYRWTAPAGGEYRVDVEADETTWFPPVIGVYTGTNVELLNEVASSFGQPLNNHKKVLFSVEEGTTYSIAVDGWSDQFGLFSLEWRPVGAPNDDLVDLEVVTGPEVSLTVDNTWSTKEEGEPDHAGNPGGASVWYHWVAPWRGTVSIEASASGFDPLLAVYEGWRLSEFPLEEVASDSGSGGLSTVEFEANQTQLLIALDGKNLGTGPGKGPITLTIHFQPYNDLFAAAEELPAEGISNWANNEGATAQPLEPAHAGSPARASVWFRWTPPRDGWAEISSYPEWLPARLAVYTGSSLATLEPVGADAATETEGAKVGFAAEGGTSYAVAVDSAGEDEGTVALSFRLVVGAPTVAMVAGTRLGTQTVPMDATWIVPSEVGTQFQLQVRVDGGSWADVITTQQTETRIDLLPGHSHQLRVRALYPDGTKSAWAAGDPFHLMAAQEKHPGIVYRGKWTLKEAPGAFGGRYRFTTDHSASATFSFTGDEIAVSSPKGPSYGKMAVLVDGAKVGVVRLHAATFQTRRLVFQQTWADAGPHTVKLKFAGGTTSTKRIGLDVILVIR